MVESVMAAPSCKLIPHPGENGKRLSCLHLQGQRCESSSRRNYHRNICAYIKNMEIKKKEKPHKTASLARKMIIKNLKTVTTHQILSFMENDAVQ